MGERNTSGGAWGARDEAPWWPEGAGEIQHQQQINEEIAHSTASSTQQLYSYKMTGGFSNNTEENTSNNFHYRLINNSNNREVNPQQQWWSQYNSGEQNSSPRTQTQSSPNSDQSQNGHQLESQLQQSQLQQLQQQVLQQTQLHLQQDIQSLQVSQAQAAALVQAQAQISQVLQQQQALQERLQLQHVQAALQRQASTLQELQQQGAASGKPRMPRARAGNKPRGRMTAYAFFVQICREEHKRKYPDEVVVFAAFSKKCAERWNTMSEEEKQRFQELAETDKKRYEKEMQDYVPSKELKVGKGRKKQQAKDPNAPKRSLSAFFLFSNDERGKVKASYPEYTMGDIAKELGRRWAAAGPDVKAKYEALSEQDKARYDREMTAYKKGPVATPQQQLDLEDSHDYDTAPIY